jgi:hypothetical protein
MKTTRTFCDVCGTDITELKKGKGSINIVGLIEVHEHCVNLHYDDVCTECITKIVGFVSSIAKVKFQFN